MRGTGIPLELRAKTIFQQIYGVFKGAIFWMLSTDKHLLIICVALSVLSLSLNWRSSIFALGGPHDSLRYIGMAETILKGEWLGEYNHMTLIRSPVYSLSLAVNSLAGWHLHVFQHSIYLISVLLLVAALRTVHVARWRALIICLFCVFHPLAFYCTNFVVSEALYVSLATGVMAGCFGVSGTYKGSMIPFCFWLIILSLSSAIFWHARPEGVWIIPFYAVCFGFLMWDCRSRLRSLWVRVSALLIVPALAVLLLSNTLASLNEKHYGIRVTNELAESNFVNTFNWLTRLAPDYRRPYVPVSKKAMEKAYAVSEHFALLRPYLSRQTNGRGWARFGCEWMGICNELAGGWTVWAIRDAVASIGAYSSGLSASRFYGSVAREIREACAGGKIRYTRNPTGNFLAPPMRLADVPRIVLSSARVLSLALTFGDFALQREDSDRLNPDLVKRYQKITHDQGQDWPVNYWKMSDIHIKIYRLVQLIGGLLFLMMVALFLFRRFKNSEARHPGPDFPLWQLTLCTLIFILSRIAIVGYLDAMSFYAQIRYLIVLYPALMVLFCLALPPTDAVSEKGRSHENR